MAKEVTVSSSQGITKAISEVVELLETQKEATVTAINMAIPSAIHLVELIKHRIKGIHQINSFESVGNTRKTRVVFKLSLKPLDKTNKGYQAPLNYEDVQEKSFVDLKGIPKKIEKNKTTTSDGFFENKHSQHEAKEETKNNRKKPDSNWGQQKRQNESENTQNRNTRGQRLRSRGQKRGPLENSEKKIYSPKKNTKDEPGKEKYVLVKSTNSNFTRELNVVFISNTVSLIFPIKKGLVLFKRNKVKSIAVKASGFALSKAVRVAEEIKRYEPNLYQTSTIVQSVIKDVYKPLEEGLDEVVKERIIDEITIVLSKTAENRNHPGFQDPIPQSLVRDLTLSELEALN